MKNDNIAQLGHPALKKTSLPITQVLSKACQNLITELITVVATAGGVGIAAPQLHHNFRLFIICSKPNSRYPSAPLMEPTAIINPEITHYSNEIITDWEGCLSVPSLRGLVPRHESITARYIDQYGQPHQQLFTGFVARIFQHELDHLNGLTFIDRVESTADLISEQEWYRQFT